MLTDARAQGGWKSLPTIEVRHLEDDNPGNAKGWNPGVGISVFTIADAAVTSQSTISFTLDDTSGVPSCMVADITAGTSFEIRCTSNPTDGAILNYAIISP